MHNQKSLHLYLGTVFVGHSYVLIQWNPSIMDIIGTQHFVRYSEVSLTQGLPVGMVLRNSAVEYVVTFSELSFAVRWQERLSRG